LGKEEISNYPYSSKLSLYRVVGNTIQKIGILDGCDFMRLGTVKGNRIFLFSNDPYPRVKVIEVNEKN